MKLASMIEKEEHLVEEKLRFYRMVNGIIAGSFFIGCALLLYKVIKVIVEWVKVRPMHGVVK